MGVQLARVTVAGLGILLILASLAIAIVGGPAAFLGAVLTFGTGAMLLVAATVERLRYRSLAADRANQPPGPGGGEPRDATVEARFQSSPEAFTDPTTGVRMRVLVDPRTGERRYVAEP